MILAGNSRKGNFHRISGHDARAQPGFPAMNVVADIIWWIVLVIGVGCGATFLWVMWQMLFASRR